MAQESNPKLQRIKQNPQRRKSPGLIVP